MFKHILKGLLIRTFGTIEDRALLKVQLAIDEDLSVEETIKCLKYYLSLHPHNINNQFYALHHLGIYYSLTRNDYDVLNYYNEALKLKDGYIEYHRTKGNELNAIKTIKALYKKTAPDFRTF